MYERILVRYGDLTLKGKNKRKFVKHAVALIKEKVNNLFVSYEKNHDRLYIKLNGEDHQAIIEGLNKVSGLLGYSLVTKTEKDIDIIAEKSLELVKEKGTFPRSFKVETKRADKTYPLESLEISKQVAGYVLKNTDHLSVDVRNPQMLLNIEVRNDGAYIFLDRIPGMGGFPVGIAGKGLLMISGGIDSPVAGFLSMKQGVEIEVIHFESTPLTSIESAQKVVDLTKKLAVFAPRNTIKLHMVPFKALHEALIKNIPESYNITIMRRMMYRIASQFAMRDHTPVLINGESVGQVASQTLESMHVVNHVTTLPILRPLVTTDKHDIITLAKKIGTYDISIKPFEDCCTVYVPKAPVTNPRVMYAERYERLFDYKTLIKEALDNIKTLDIHKDTDLHLEYEGFTVSEALEE